MFFRNKVLIFQKNILDFLLPFAKNFTKKFHILIEDDYDYYYDDQELSEEWEDYSDDINRFVPCGLKKSNNYWR